MAARHRGVLRDAWLWYALAGVGACAAHFLLPAAQNAIYLLIGGSAVAAIVIGRRVHASYQRGWRTLAVGIFLYSLGDLVYTVIATTTGTEPFPSLADGPYVIGQVLVVIGILGLAAPIERGLYRPASIDGPADARRGLHERRARVRRSDRDRLRRVGQPIAGRIFQGRGSSSWMPRGQGR